MTHSHLVTEIASMTETMRRNGEEIEVEISPAKLVYDKFTGVAFSQILLKPRYIKAPPDITVEHLGEFLFQAYNREFEQEVQRLAEEKEEKKNASMEEGEIEDEEEKYKEVSSILPDPKPCLHERPCLFYLMDHSYTIRIVLPHETLCSALCNSLSTEKGDHFVLFFDTDKQLSVREAPNLPTIHEIVGNRFASHLLGHEEKKDCGRQQEISNSLDESFIKKGTDNPQLPKQSASKDDPSLNHSKASTDLAETEKSH